MKCHIKQLGLGFMEKIQNGVRASILWKSYPKSTWVSSSKGCYDRKHSEHLPADPGEDTGLYKHKQIREQIHVFYSFKIPAPFSL